MLTRCSAILLDEGILILEVKYDILIGPNQCAMNTEDNDFHFKKSLGGKNNQLNLTFSVAIYKHKMALINTF